MNKRPNCYFTYQNQSEAFKTEHTPSQSEAFKTKHTSKTLSQSKAFRTEQKIPNLTHCRFIFWFLFVCHDNTCRQQKIN